MDLRKPKYQLKDVRKAIEKKEIIPNLGVIESAHSLGFSETEVYQQILSLKSNDFYKSTSEYYNHKVWQDVYKKEINGIPIYIKFKLIEGSFIITSFKKDTDKLKGEEDV